MLSATTEGTAFLRDRHAEFDAELERLVAQVKATLPPQILSMRLGDFLQLSELGGSLAAVPNSAAKRAKTSQSDCYSSASTATSLTATPKTATRRSSRYANIDFYELYGENGAAEKTPSRHAALTGRLSSLGPVLATPSNNEPARHSTASLFNPHLPQTPVNATASKNRVRLTIKAAPSAVPATVHKTQSQSQSQAQSQSQSQSQPQLQPQPQSHRPATARKAPYSLASHLPPASPATEIVQFQLDDGKIIDFDLSRSPQSALAEADLLGSEAMGEVRAKIETYATQFMQYLKFFKKFKPQQHK